MKRRHQPFGLSLAIVAVSALGVFHAWPEASGDAEQVPPTTAAPTPTAAIEFEGSSACGAVHYRVVGVPVHRDLPPCACESCRKMSGALELPWVRVKAADFAITSGEPKLVRLEGLAGCAEHGVFAVCPGCGTMTHWLPDNEDMVDIVVGTLDDPSLYREPGADAVTAALRREFDESFRMLADGVARLDDEAWGQGEPTWTEVPARVALHILDTAQFYVADSHEGFAPEPAGLRFWDSPIEDLPDRAETLEHIERVRQLVDDYLVENGDDGLRRGLAGTAPTEQRRVQWMTYALRHQQHHVAQLSAQCKIRGFGAAAWEAEAE